MADLADPFDRGAYPKLLYREWVLMHQRGVSVEQIATLNDRKVDHVLQYLRKVHQRSPELFATRPARHIVYDRPRPRPEAWPDRDRRWKAVLAELAAFLAEHGRRPYSGAYASPEGKLVHWLNVQRNQDRSGALLGHRVRWLTEVLPGWRTDTRSLHYDAAWRLNLTQVVAFRTEHGRWPRRGINPEHAVLGRWLQHQRIRLHRDTLDPDRRAALDTHLPGWHTDHP